jgi:hypothetical protein
LNRNIFLGETIDARRNSLRIGRGWGLGAPSSGLGCGVYDEAISGDAGTGLGLNPAPPSIILGSGVNEILGSVTFSFNGQVPSDTDAFDLVVGAGKTILSIVISTSLRDEGGGVLNSIVWTLLGGTTSGSGSTSVPTAGTSLFGSILPVGEGTYRLDALGLTGGLAPSQYRTADYTIAVNVESTPSPVPLPAGAGLLAASLGLLALLRRRRT